jgi:hypothetical protein
MELSIDRVPRKTEKGSAIVEFAFVAPFLCLLLLGTVSVGMTLTKSLQAGVVSRDCGLMFMRQVDFTLEQNKRLAVKLASGMGMTTTGGDGAVVLTELLRIGADDCAAGGLSLAACSNFDQVVAVKRVTIGNASLFLSSFGTPSTSLIGPTGDIAVSNYLTNVSVRAPNLSSLMTLGAGERAFASEAYFLTPEINLPGYRSNTYVYQRNIF